MLNGKVVFDNQRLLRHGAGPTFTTRGQSSLSSAMSYYANRRYDQQWPLSPTNWRDES